MIEKKEDVRFARSRKAQQSSAFELAKKELKTLMVLVPAMHILTTGPRTRRLPAGNHGASGDRKPLESRSRGVAPRRKMGSLNRQVSRGHTSKVRCRSRCGANRFLLLLKLLLKQRTLGSSGPQYQTGLWLSSLARLSLLRLSHSAHKLQARQQAARFPARCICQGAINRRPRSPSAFGRMMPVFFAAS